MDSQGLTLETATSTENLLPVILAIRDHCGRESGCAIYRLPAVIGRDEGADVQLTDPWVSHRHFEVDQVGDALVVRDLDSRNGIFMHGRRRRESQVLSGEQVTVGRTEIILRYPGTAVEADGSTPPGRELPQTPFPDTLELL
jgi:predicted component of type VI protein secretion system